jgi:hypothetical protein
MNPRSWAYLRYEKSRVALQSYNPDFGKLISLVA